MPNQTKKNTVNFKVSYLDTAPEIKHRYPRNTLQEVIEEFMKSDKPAIRIDPGDHYSSLEHARSAWRCAIWRNRYKIAVTINEEENCIYLIKRGKLSER